MNMKKKKDDKKKKEKSRKKTLNGITKGQLEHWPHG